MTMRKQTLAATPRGERSDIQSANGMFKNAEVRRKPGAGVEVTLPSELEMAARLQTFPPKNRCCPVAFA